MQEQDGDQCADQAYFTSAGAGASGPGGGNKDKGSEVTSALPLEALCCVFFRMCSRVCSLR